MKHYKYKEYIKNVFPCIGYGVFCGALVGCLIFFFKLLAQKAEAISRKLFALSQGRPLYIALIFIGLALAACIMYFIHKKAPESRGGGIPRSEGVLRGVLSFRWLRTLLGTFFGSMLSFLCGLPLGSEGPAVLMGTSVGAMCGGVSRNRSIWSRYVMTGGAGAGFAVATGAPLSGILFALEEIHKRFTPMLVLTVSMSVVSASYVNQLLCKAFGMSAGLFHIEEFCDFALSDIGYLLILGVLVALSVALFDFSIAFFGDCAKKWTKFATPLVKLLTVFLISGILAFCFGDALYSGHHVIEEVMENNKTLIFLALLFLIRLLMMLFVTDSGVTGGIFIPTLAIGAAFAALVSKLLLAIGMDESLFATAVFLGMCAFIGGTLRAPLTASVLFIELTGRYTNLLFVAMVIFTVSFLTEIFNLTPFYDRALENMEHAQNQGKHKEIAHFEMKVSENSFVVGKAVRDIMWPSSSVVIAITRADESQKDMDNDGEKKLYVGDTVVLRAAFFDEAEIKSILQGLMGSDHPIIRQKESE